MPPALVSDLHVSTRVSRNLTLCASMSLMVLSRFKTTTRSALIRSSCFETTARSALSRSSRSLACFALFACDCLAEARFLSRRMSIFVSRCDAEGGVRTATEAYVGLASARGGGLVVRCFLDPGTSLARCTAAEGDGCAAIAAEAGGCAVIAVEAGGCAMAGADNLLARSKADRRDG